MITSQPRLSRTEKGFTLIEILVAVVIISIILSIALIKFDIDSFESLLKQESSRIARMLELADQEAIFQGQDIGLLLEDNQYQFFVYVKRGWKPLQDNLLKKKTLPPDMELTLTLDGLEIRPETSGSIKKKPQIIIFSSGEWTPFEIRLRQAGHPELTYVLSNTRTGKLEISRETL